MFTVMGKRVKSWYNKNGPKSDMLFKKSNTSETSASLPENQKNKQLHI